MNHTFSSLLSLPFIARVLGVLALAAPLLEQSAHATDKIWKNTNTNFNTNGSWSPSGVPGAGDFADFNSAMVMQPHLSSSVTIQALSFSTAASSGYDLTSSNTGVKFTLTNTGNGATSAINSANTSGTNTIDAPIVLGAAANSTQYFTQASGGKLVVNGVISNTNNVTLSLGGGGTIQLGGANTYAGGTTLASGTTLNINNATALGTGAFTINGGTIDNTTAGAITMTNNNAITFGGDFTFGGTQNLNFGTGAITNAGNRTITLNGTNSTLTFGGTMTNTSNAAQTTTVNGASNTLSLGGYALSSNATNRIDVINGTGNVTITGAVTNGGTATASGLTYSGSGVLTLSGTNTYTGNTTVNSGTLLVNGSTHANSSVSVNNSGTTLGGTGTINGQATVSSGAKLLGGTGSAASGTLTLSNNLTLNNGSIIELALGASGAHSTLARTGGTWVFSGTQAFTFIDLGAQATTYSSIITGLAADPGSEGSWTITDAGWIGYFTYNGGNIDLTITNAPEPATYLPGVLTLGALLLHQRRRWRSLVCKH